MSREKKAPSLSADPPSTDLESKEKIRELRKILELSQEKFAEKLGVKRIAAARWESGKFHPTADKYIQLAKLARGKAPRLARWFWERVGVDIPTLASLFPELERTFQAAEKRLKKAASAEDFVHLPILQGIWDGTHQEALNRMRAPLLASRSEVEKWVMVPKEYVPNPTTTSCVSAPDWNMNPAFGLGDIVVVDSSPLASPAIGDFPGLVRLKGQILAVHFSSRDKSNCLRRGLHFRKLYTEDSPPFVSFDSYLTDLLTKDFFMKIKQDMELPEILELSRLEQSRSRGVSDNGEWCVLGVATCWIHPSAHALRVLEKGART